MFAKRRRCVGGLLALIAALVLVVPVSAGGWTNVTLDTVPTNLQAGQPLALGFMVRQHGITPISNVTPTLKARNAATGETFSLIVARQERSATSSLMSPFPSAGAWQWSVTPAPFPEVELGNVTILAAGAAAPQQSAQSGPQAESRGLSFATLAFAARPCAGSASWRSCWPSDSVSGTSAPRSCAGDRSARGR